MLTFGLRADPSIVVQAAPIVEVRPDLLTFRDDVFEQTVVLPYGAFPDAKPGDFYVITGDGEASVIDKSTFGSDYRRV